MQAILIAPDGEEREFLSYTLRQMGLTVHGLAGVDTAVTTLSQKTVDLILLAPNQTDSPLADVKALRAVSQASLLLLADWLTEGDHCDVLDAGVDLVLQRPVSPRILSRYTRIFLRRGGSIPVGLLSPVQIGLVQLDPNTRTVTTPHLGAKRLTPLEFRLLYLLMSNPGQVIPLETIIERVWGYSGDGNRELVRGLVRRLRRKIEPDPSHPQYIFNHPGLGYQFKDLTGF
ncbi:MAG TPA: response regulator transcription factor [Anaerolineae bacterium]|nr:response regulator transcription factor [Anaerolineae bacterium]